MSLLHATVITDLVCSIFYSPDGTEVWNVYHAVSSPHGGCNPKRATFVMKVITAGGELDFGKPG